MKENKTKKIIFISVIVVLLILVAVVIILIPNKDNSIDKGNENIVSSLVAATQSEIDMQIKNDLETNKYKLNDARIYLNPYNVSPMSALLVFVSDTETEVEVTVKGKNNDDLVTKYDKEKYHYIPIFGLYQKHENKIEVKLGTGESKTFTITTGEFDFYPVTTVNQMDTANLNNDFYFITSPITMRSIALDSYGELRWYTEAMYYHDIVSLENGHMLIGNGSLNQYGLTTELVEIDYLGRIYNVYNIEEGYLNNFFVKEDGNIIMASKNSERSTYSDYIIEIDGKTGKIVKTVDVFKLFEDIDPVYTNDLNEGYFYNSGIEYYDETDTLLLTYWGGEFVISVDYSDASINWIFSNPDNFTSYFNPYLLKNSNDFIYPKSMHSAKLINNTLKVFDNGYSTNKGDSNSANLMGSYSSANTYEINGKNISLTKSIDEGKNHFSYALGDYEIVNDNTEIVLFGRELKGLDYSLGIDINNYDYNFTRLIEKKNDNTVLDMTIDWPTHTVLKIDMSKYNGFDFREAGYMTTLTPSQKGRITEDILASIKSATESLDYSFGYSNNIIESNVLFMYSDSAKIILINDLEEGAVYDLKIKNKETSEKIVTDLQKGKYYVFVLENEVMYKTGKFLEIK